MNAYALRMVAKGLATYVPGLRRLRKALFKGKARLEGTNSARYCYSVWLRHLVKVRRCGLAGRFETVAELGPGESLGTGLAAILSGADRYYALDVVAAADRAQNLRVFDEVVELFRHREPIPGPAEFPRVAPVLDSYAFPHEILTPDLLARCLSEERVGSIREALASASGASGPIRIGYRAPWHGPQVIERGTVDWVFSQAVLQHVDDLELTYGALGAWLRPGGVTSHQISFGSYGTAREWDGHWQYSDRMWKIVRGSRPYLINRQPHSAHMDLLKRFGFEVVCDERFTDKTGLPRERLAARFRRMSEEDRMTQYTFLVAVKREAAERAGP